MGIIISPPLARTVVEHLKFVLLPEGRVLVVLVASGGMTRDKVIRPERTFRQEDLDRISAHLNAHYSGWTLEAIRGELETQLVNDKEKYDRLVGGALAAVRPGAAGTTMKPAKCTWMAPHSSPPCWASPARNKCGKLLSTIEERGRLIALLDGCIEGPEPVHVELGVKKITDAGKHLALISAPYMQNAQMQGALGIWDRCACTTSG